MSTSDPAAENLSPSQLAFLRARLAGASITAAAAQAERSTEAVRLWRRDSLAFRQAEAELGRVILSEGCYLALENVRQANDTLGGLLSGPENTPRERIAAARAVLAAAPQFASHLQLEARLAEMEQELITVRAELEKVSCDLRYSLGHRSRLSRDLDEARADLRTTRQELVRIGTEEALRVANPPWQLLGSIRAQQALLAASDQPQPESEPAAADEPSTPAAPADSSASADPVMPGETASNPKESQVPIDVDAQGSADETASNPKESQVPSALNVLDSSSPVRPPALEEIALVPENEPYWPTAVETWERRVQAVIDCGPEGLPPGRMLSPAERFLALCCLCRVHGEPYPEEEHVIGLRNLNLSPDGTRLMLEDDPGPCGLRVLERGVVVTATRLAHLGLEWDRIPLLPGGVTLQATDGTLRYPFSIPNWT